MPGASELDLVGAPSDGIATYKIRLGSEERRYAAIESPFSRTGCHGPSFCACGRARGGLCTRCAAGERGAGGRACTAVGASAGPVVTSLQYHLAGAAGTGRARRLPTFQDPAAASRWRRAERRSMRVDIALVVAGHISATLRTMRHAMRRTSGPYGEFWWLCALVGLVS